jgi:hypothetical protein
VEASKLYWSDPESRKKQSDIAKKLCEDPLTKQRKSENMKKFWSDPENRKKRTYAITHAIKRNNAENIKKFWNTHPEAKIKQSKISTIRWSTIESRMQLCEIAIGGFWYGNVQYYVRPQYCEKFTPEFKNRVRAYWNYTCAECGFVQIPKRTLHVHHVHYDKKMCCNGSPRDVVPLCRSCHLKTNHNRKRWEQHFVELIYSNDPTGKCFFTKEEMEVYLGNT